MIHWERLKLVPDLLLNFQLTLDRLILFFMQICLLKVVTFIDLSAPCSQLTAWKFQRTEQNIFGPDITETIVSAPLNKPTFRKYCFCSLKMKRFSSILYDWMMIDRTHNWLRSFLKEYAYFYARLWNIKNYEVIPKQKRIIFRMILISDYECSSRIIYWFYAQN